MSPSPFRDELIILLISQSQRQVPFRNPRLGRRIPDHVELRSLPCLLPLLHPGHIQLRDLLHLAPCPFPSRDPGPLLSTGTLMFPALTSLLRVSWLHAHLRRLDALDVSMAFTAIRPTFSFSRMWA